jgi:hypothetical protein
MSADIPTIPRLRLQDANTGNEFAQRPSPFSIAPSGTATPTSTEESTLLSNIDEVFRQARAAMLTGDDWDGEGSSWYTEGALHRVMLFFFRNAIPIVRLTQRPIDAPHVMPSDSGSIDLRWKSASRQLLINIPADPSAHGDFYGKNSLGQVIKGNLDLSANNQWLLMWLMQ